MLEMDKYAALLCLCFTRNNVLRSYQQTAVLIHGLAYCKNNSYSRLKITASSSRQEQEINLFNISFPHICQ
jgi:hypothetical protein